MAKRGDPRRQRKYRAIRLTVLARDQYTCYYCNQPANTVDHIIPVDIYLPGCPPRPEMLMDAILKLHEQIGNEKLGPNREKIIREVEAAALAAKPTHQLKGLLA